MAASRFWAAWQAALQVRNMVHCMLPWACGVCHLEDNLRRLTWILIARL